SSLSNTYYSLGHPGCDLSAHPEVKKADVIHLHWVAGFQSVHSISRLQKLNKPLIWTFHDQRPLTGGCHFTAGCKKYTTDCEKCPQLLDDRNNYAATNLYEATHMLHREELVVVAPSRWLANCARESLLYRVSRVETIPYGLETDVFFQVNRKAAREEMKIPTDGIYLLFGADYGSEKRKGFSLLMSALQICLQQPAFLQAAAEKKIRVLCFGRPNPELVSLAIDIQNLGYINSDEQMRLVYAASDLFLLSSLEDNLPNTMMESMACGTPVLGFKVGGVPDLVREGVTGFIAEDVSAEGFAGTLLRALEKKEAFESMGMAGRKMMEDHFSLQNQASAYLELYEDVRRNLKQKWHHTFNSRLPLILPEALRKYTAMAGESNGEVLRRKEIEKRVATLLTNSGLREEEMADLLKKVVDEYDPLLSEEGPRKKRRRASGGWLGRIFGGRKA
ncbi:MAG: putative glycosyl transferase, group 1, partial [Verrucomicrobiales bacterium]|nr:putative glycosyl transferase, group 1 [Verrucomicrobiales bacterium]